MSEGLPSFGKKYDAKKAELRELIRTGRISVLETFVGEESHDRGIRQFACYFCGNKIVDHLYALEVVKYVKGDKESRATYYIDGCCYHDARRIQYINGVPINLN